VIRIPSLSSNVVEARVELKSRYGKPRTLDDVAAVLPRASLVGRFAPTVVDDPLTPFGAVSNSRKGPR
jgi:hypothetical protein